jgi:phospholipid-translocating ATPase
MQQADVSIELVHKSKSSSANCYPQVNAGDIVVTSLTQIRDLLLVHGKHHSERSTNLILELFYHSHFLGMTLFFFNWFCNFTATSLHDSIMLLLVNPLFQVPNLLVYGLYDQPSDAQINKSLPGLYVDGIIRKKYSMHHFTLTSAA